MSDSAAGAAPDHLARRPRSARRRTLFALLATLVPVLTAEGIARGWLSLGMSPERRARYALPEDFPAASKYAPHPYFSYGLQPGYRSAGVSHSSQGYRGRPLAIPKPTGGFRIVALGGSTTYGEFIDGDERTFPARLETILRSECHRPDVEVINAGVPGYSSWESLADFQFHALDFEPDLALVYFGVNDVHARLVEPEHFRADNSGRRRAWSTPIEARLARVSVLARILGRELGVWNPPGIENYTMAPSAIRSARRTERLDLLDANSIEPFRRNLRSLVGVARANGCRPVLVTWACSHEIGDYVSLPHYRRGVAELNDAVRRIAAETGSDLIDLAPEMPTSTDHWRDGRHVNAKGADRQARILAERLVRGGLLRKGLGPAVEAIPPARSAAADRPDSSAAAPRAN